MGKGRREEAYDDGTELNSMDHGPRQSMPGEMPGSDLVGMGDTTTIPRLQYEKFERLKIEKIEVELIEMDSHILPGWFVEWCCWIVSKVSKLGAFQLPLFEMSLRLIEGHFGSSIKSYFLFTRRLFMLNLTAFLMWWFGVIWPCFWFFDPTNVREQGFSIFLSLMSGDGLEDSPIFYGGYHARMVFNKTSKVPFPFAASFPTVWTHEGDLQFHQMDTWYFLCFGGTFFLMLYAVVNAIVGTYGRSYDLPPAGRDYNWGIASFGACDFGSTEPSAVGFYKKGAQTKLTELLATAKGKRAEADHDLYAKLHDAGKKVVALSFLAALVVGTSWLITMCLVAQGDLATYLNEWGLSALAGLTPVLAPLVVSFLNSVTPIIVTIIVLKTFTRSSRSEHELEEPLFSELDVAGGETVSFDFETHEDGSKGHTIVCMFKGQPIQVKWKSPKEGPTEPMADLNLKTVRYKVGGDVVVWDIKADEPEKTEVKFENPSFGLPDFLFKDQAELMRHCSNEDKEENEANKCPHRDKIFIHPDGRVCATPKRKGCCSCLKPSSLPYSVALMKNDLEFNPMDKDKNKAFVIPNPHDARHPNIQIKMFKTGKDIAPQEIEHSPYRGGKWWQKHLNETPFLGTTGRLPGIKVMWTTTASPAAPDHVLTFKSEDKDKGVTGIEPKQRTRSPYKTPTVTLSDGTKFINPCWFLNGEPIQASVVTDWVEKYYGDDPIPLSRCHVENFCHVEGQDAEHDTKGPPFQIITLPLHHGSHSKPFMFYNPVTVAVHHNPVFSAQAIVLNTLMFTWVLKIVNALILFSTTETYIYNLCADPVASVDTPQNIIDCACPRTKIGKQFWSAIFADMVFTVFVKLGPGFLYWIKWKCIKKIPKSDLIALQALKSEFQLEPSIIDLMYKQALVWIGMVYSPMILGLGMVSMFLSFFVNKWALLWFMKSAAKSTGAGNQDRLFNIFLGLTLLASCYPAMSILTKDNSLYGQTCGPFVSIDPKTGYSTYGNGTGSVLPKDNILYNMLHWQIKADNDTATVELEETYVNPLMLLTIIIFCGVCNCYYRARAIQAERLGALAVSELEKEITEKKDILSRMQESQEEADGLEDADDETVFTFWFDADLRSQVASQALKRVQKHRERMDPGGRIAARSKKLWRMLPCLFCLAIIVVLLVGYFSQWSVPAEVDVQQG